MEISQTKTQYNRAALLLGNTFLYRVGFTTFMYLLNAINAIVNIEAHAKICDVDPATRHQTWPNFQVPVDRLAIQNGILAIAMAMSVNARL